MKNQILAKIIEDIAPNITDTIKVEKLPERNLPIDQDVDRQGKDTIRMLTTETRLHSLYEVKRDTTSFADGNGIIIKEYLHVKI